MGSNLPISRLVPVSVNLAPSPAQGQNISDLLVLGSTATIDVVQRISIYSSLSAVASEFASNTPEYLAAVAWFGQSPQPNQIKIGRWVKTNSSGQLIGAPVSAANQLMAVWSAITNGSFKVTVDGGVQQSVTGLNFSAAATMAAVAVIIQAAITGATVTWDTFDQNFIFTSNTSTPGVSAVSFLTAGASGTDISGLLGGLTATAAYLAPSTAAETALTAVQLFDNQFGQQFYAVVIPEAASNDHLAVAAYVEAATNKHCYGVGTTDANAIVSSATSDIAYLLKQLAYKKTFVQYSSTSVYAIASLLGRILTVNYQGNNTVITLMYKQEPGIAAESLSATQLAALEAKNCNVFVAYNNNTAIIEPGIAASGDFIDTVIGIDVLALAIQTAVYNLLYSSTTKIPQTDAGNNIILTAIEQTCAQFAQDSLLAPGTWTTAGFGGLNQGDFLPKGYYVYAPPVSLQASADRAARRSVTFQVAAKLAGAIHTVSVLINVNR
jgi:hypothetical protein